MNGFQALVLGTVQGLTEFLPISSTAHLRLVPYFLGWEDPGAAASAVIQLGTLAAVFVYFARDIGHLTAAAVDGLRHGSFNHTPQSRLAWAIIPGTLPIAALGLGFRDFIENGARSLPLIAGALIVLALFLVVAELVGQRHRTMADLGFWHIQFIGVCQALALVPGCSRSGSTIMGGLFAGLERHDAAYFSFLLSLPAVGAAGALELVDLLEGGLAGEGLANLGIAVLAAGVSGYLSIGFLLRYLQRHATYLFVVYRILLGLVIVFTL
ncbi:MAG: undecaprenyl-diphosphatase UppP [Candidatus Latescibacterota bacterium]